MTDIQPERRGPGRPPNPKPAADLPVRRRNKAFDHSGVLKLGVDESKKDPKYDYRWVREGDNSARLAQLHAEDWDQCSEAEFGHSVKRAVGTQKNGQPEYAYLCKKRKEFVDEDRREKHSRSQERMNALRRGDTGKSDALKVGDKANTYIPDEGISISD